MSSDDTVKPVPFASRRPTGEASSSSDSSHRKRTKFLHHSKDGFDSNCEVETEGECDESDVAKVDQRVKMDLIEDLLQIVFSFLDPPNLCKVAPEFVCSGAPDEHNHGYSI
ncbi:hypothetical protein S83_012582 [Arachis hypogaea]